MKRQVTRKMRMNANLRKTSDHLQQAQKLTKRKAAVLKQTKASKDQNFPKEKRCNQNTEESVKKSFRRNTKQRQLQQYLTRRVIAPLVRCIRSLIQSMAHLQQKLIHIRKRPLLTTLAIKHLTHRIFLQQRLMLSTKISL